MAFSSSNKTSAKALANSVLPTPVGPKKINDPTGLFGSCNPARLRLTASQTAPTASFWPMSLLPISASKFNNLALSDCNILFTGIPVHLETTSATSSAVTSSLVMRCSAGIVPSFDSSSTKVSSSFLMPSYFNSAALGVSDSRSAISNCLLNSSNCVLVF